MLEKHLPTCVGFSCQVQSICFESSMRSVSFRLVLLEKFLSMFVLDPRFLYFHQVFLSAWSQLFTNLFFRLNSGLVKSFQLEYVL